MPKGGVRTSISVQARFQTQGFGGNALFGAGAPLTPPDQMPVRHYDFVVGENRVYTPRAYEPFTFANLRAFANVELVRLAIETRKDQIERLQWRVRSKDEKKPKRGAEGRIKSAEALLRKPDGIHDFATWLKALLEDLFVLDAPAVERRRTNGGDLIGLDYVPGDTIKVLVDDTGRRPRYPLEAFQQVIKGRVWNNLTDRDLIYRPRNVRTNHLYGFGPVEQIVVTINTLLARQTRQLAWFTEGNTPPGVMSAPEGWSPDQIKMYQDWFDERLRGNAAARSGIIWGPFGAKYSPFKDPPLKDDFDEWLARIVCYCFNLPPTPFIKQMNRATSETDAERALEEGLEPTKSWAKRMLDDVIQEDLGFEDLEFDWVVTRDIDPKIQAEIDDLALRNGSTTLDEVRDARGQQPYPDKMGTHPMVYVKDGVIKLDDAIRASTATATAAEKLANAPLPEAGAQPGKPAAAKPEPEPEES